MHKITKIKESEDPAHLSASSEQEYRNNLNDGGNLSPNVDYWIIGEIIQGPIVGQSMIVDRWNRNGVISRGIFQTSTITELTEKGFKTLNSEYKVEQVEEEEILTCGN